MATFAVYFSRLGIDGLTKHEHAGSFKNIEDAYRHLLRERNLVDGFVKSGGKKVHLDNPVRMRELMAQVKAEEA